MYIGRILILKQTRKEHIIKRIEDERRIRNCDWCGKPIEVTPYALRTNKHFFCNRECSNNFAKADKVLLKCAVCGKEFYRKKSRIDKMKDMNNATCSKKCMYTLRKKLYKGNGNHQYGLRGNKNASFKTGERNTRYGYHLILSPNHPFNVNGYILEHRLTAEKYLLTDDNSVEIDGEKYLKPECVVHHIDFDKLNNVKDNLYIFNSESKHTLFHNLLGIKFNTIREFEEYYEDKYTNKILNYDWIYRAYIEYNLSINQISKYFDIPYKAISSQVYLYKLDESKKDANKVLNNIIKELKGKNMQIKIKYINNAIDKIKKIENGDWIDLRSAETIKLKAGEFKLIPLGVAMELPEGYEAYIVPRGSTFKNFGVIQTNHHGVVDESYKGDNDQWFFPAYALKDTIINFNDRICQFRIQKKMPEVEFKEVDELTNEDRGGHGSTGKN